LLFTHLNCAEAFILYYGSTGDTPEPLQGHANCGDCLIYWNNL